MGTSESKLAVTTPKPDLCQKLRNQHLSHLVDPRSPSADINRTPIQVAASLQTPIAVECGNPTSSDPRSPSLGITRTPIKDMMRATVNSFTRQLSLLFLTDGLNVDKGLLTEASNGNGHECSVRDSAEPLLPSLDLAPKTADAQVEVELGMEADQLLEEDEDDGMGGVTIKGSLSLLTVHEGVVESQTPVGDSPLPPPPPSQLDISESLPEDASPALVPEPLRDAVEYPQPSAAPVVSASQTGSEPQTIKRLTFSTQSPSQVVFKPQWLGVGFGSTGVRARGLQSRGKGTSSPLSQRGGPVAGNENRGQAAKVKQRGKQANVFKTAGECRSPLQILKETNSPRESALQTKSKTFTPDRSKLSHAERRTWSLSLDKENQI